VMNVNMWQHAATRENVEALKRRGNRVIEPGSGYLACGMTGPGRMAEPEEIAAAIEREARQRRDLEGETVLITAGPTQEPLDPVRYISNRSSGKMGYALAEAGAARGARVVLISGPVHLGAPQGRKRFTLPAGGEQKPVGNGLRCIQCQQVHVAGERQMLEAVVENVRVHLETLFRSLPAAKTVGADDERNSRKHTGQNRRLIANLTRVRVAACAGLDNDHFCLAAAAVPSRENAGFPSLAQQDVGDACHQGCLPGSTHDEVSHTYHGPCQAADLEPAAFVASVAQCNAEAESRRKWEQ